MAEFTLAALKAELDADPEGLGYAAAGWPSSGDQEIADLINDPANGGSIERDLVMPKELREQIEISEWRALDPADREYLDLVLEGTDEIDTRNTTEVRAALLAIFGAGTTTRNNMVAVVSRQGSRAEVLWGEGIFISASQVGQAANV